MSTRFIRQSSDAAASWTGSDAGIGVDSDDKLLYYNPDGTRRLVASGAASIATVAATQTAAANGGTTFLDASTEFATTLPAPVLGFRHTFIVKTAPSGADYTITSGSSVNIIKGAVFSSDLDASGDADFEVTGVDVISFVSAKAVAGDRVEIFCDGTNYFAHCFCTVFDAITLA